MSQTEEDARRRSAAANSRAPRRLEMSPQQSALLLNLLSDNARAWNAPLRVQLHQQVSGTETYNAKLALSKGEV